MVSPVAARNGAPPISISYIKAPSAYTSVRASAGRPSTCSGAMYSGVPIVMPGLVSLQASDEVLRAMPKSRTLTKSVCPSRATRKTFSGFRSR